MGNIIASDDWWRIEDDGTLYVYCVGAIPDYDNEPPDYAKPPWYQWSSPYLNDQHFYIRNIVIADTVTTIGGGTFAFCYVDHVNIPDSVTTIKGFAFNSSLQSISIPTSVTSIEYDAFSRSEDDPLDVYYAGTKQQWMDIYMETYTDPPCFLSGKAATNLAIWDKDHQLIFSTREDDDSPILAYGTRWWIESDGTMYIHMPGDMTNYDSVNQWSLFGDGYSATSVVILDGTTTIASGAFEFTPNITEVTIPNSVTTIKNGAFEGCNQLTDVYYSGTQSQWSQINISDNGNEYLLDANIHYNYNPNPIEEVNNMAIEKFKFADQANIRTAAETLLKATNTRIKERILTSSTYSNDYQDGNHVLSAAALYTLIGNLAAYATNDGTGTDIVSKIKALDLAIGTVEDTSEDETVYGAIAAVQDRISALTHLTYQVVVGDITTEVPIDEAAEDVIYLQRKNDSYKVGRDGYLKDTNNNTVAITDETTNTEYACYYNQGNGYYYRADATYAYAVADPAVELESNDSIFGGETPDPTAVNSEGFLVDSDEIVVAGTEAGARYAAVYDSTAEKWYKADQSVTGYVASSTQLASDDDLFDDVDLVADETYTLYVCQITYTGEERTGIQWLEVGNTDITLTDYVSKSDYDVRELQQRIMEPMTAEVIIQQVHDAFDATDPYGANAQTTSYLDSWLPSNP